MSVWGGENYVTEAQFEVRPIAPFRAAQLRPEGETLIGATSMFSGTLEDSNTYDNSLCWRITRPFPATVAAISGVIETQDE